MKYVLWPDGEVTIGNTWRECEVRARRDQWSKVIARNPQEFRRDMRRRAIVWAGRRLGRFVPIKGPSRKFFERLEACGMCRMEEMNP